MNLSKACYFLKIGQIYEFCIILYEKAFSRILPSSEIARNQNCLCVDRKILTPRVEDIPGLIIHKAELVVDDELHS